MYGKQKKGSEKRFPCFCEFSQLMRFLFQRVKPPIKSRRKTDLILRSIRGKNTNTNNYSKRRHQFNVNELRRLARIAKIPGRENLNRLQLAEALDRHYAAARILIGWRARRRLAVQARTASPQPVEVINNFDPEANAYLDPISFEPLHEPIFVFKINASKHVHYSLECILEYLVRGKVFKDPVTGLAYKDSHLREIDQLAHQYAIRAPSVLLLSRSAQPQLQREHQNLVCGLERIAGSYIEQFRRIIQKESPFVDPGASALLFNARLNLEFLDIYRQLLDADPEAADISMKQWSTFLKGPPTSPTPDPEKFLQPILNWMEKVRTRQVE